MFEGKRAVGVAYLRGGEVHHVRARREVIVSCGVFQTPQLLLLSGIGQPDILKNLGISVRHVLPGVGQNLQDHPDFVFAYSSDDPNMFGYSFAEAARLTPAFAEYQHTRRGLFASNIAECGAFLKTAPELEAPDLQLHFGFAVVVDHGRTFHWGTGFSCHVSLLTPKSRGSVSLSSPDAASRDRSTISRGARGPRVHGEGFQADSATDGCASSPAIKERGSIHEKHRARR
jgi:choline dehydrogenase-like flavoprotein